MSDLTAFQDAFCAALAGRGEALTPWLPQGPQAPGISVYRNTVVKGSVDVLAATYETVVHLVGEEWFRAAAAAYAVERPPSRPSMMDYGDDFPDWLAAFEPAADIPYLAGVARLDRLWSEAYFAADADTLPSAAFADLTAEALDGLTATLHPSVRLAVFAQNLVSLWLAHRAPGGVAGFELRDDPEQALVTRVGQEVQVRRIDPAAYDFLTACAAGESLLQAAERALTTDPSASLTKIAAVAIEAGAFRALEPLKGTETVS